MNAWSPVSRTIWEELEGVSLLEGVCRCWRIYVPGSGLCILGREPAGIHKAMKLNSKERVEESLE